MIFITEKQSMKIEELYKLIKKMENACPVECVTNISLEKNSHLKIRLEWLFLMGGRIRSYGVLVGFDEDIERIIDQQENKMRLLENKIQQQQRNNQQ